jgi:hypothetical protein
MPRKPKGKCFVSEKPQYSFKENVHKKVCQNLPADYEHEGQYYCVLHFPNEQKHKTTDFNNILKARLENQESNFQYIYFSDRVYLTQLEFTNEADFKGCTFVQDADFIDLIFNERAIFTNTVFMQDSWFAHVTFVKNAYFSNSVFKENSEFVFLETYIGEKIYFTDVVFRGEAIFDNINALEGKNIRLHLDDVRTENADRIYFKNTHLYPNWFVNVNSRKFIFHNIDWENADETTTSVRAEIKILKDCGIYPRRNRLLTLACRQLADNYEENNHFEQASIFRQMANESKRLEEYKGFKVWSLHWWYWLSSFYGERWMRALAVLGSILLIFAVIYTLTDFQVCPTDKPLASSIQQNLCETRTLGFGESILQSLATTTFQNIEYQKPVTLAGEIIRILEKIFAPIQAALLALAIRRKFMR